MVLEIRILPETTKAQSLAHAKLPIRIPGKSLSIRRGMEFLNADELIARLTFENYAHRLTL